MDGPRSSGANAQEGSTANTYIPRSAMPLVPANPVALNIQGVSTTDGNLNIAGRDMHITNVNNYHYNSSTSHEGFSNVPALQKIRNLRPFHMDILAKATPGTGIWLFKTDHWLLWLDLNGRIHILWGTGIPAAGKSVLASIVINELEARAAKAGSNICVAYVFIRYSDAADMTIRGFLEVLVKQTVERHADCAGIAAQVYARHTAESTQPSVAELLQLLQRFTEMKTVTFYIIDALDEAPDRLQLELIKKLASLNARLFITSRPLKTVEARAPDAHRFTIAAQDQDLDLHIAQGIDHSPDLQVVFEQDPSLREEAVSSIKKNCGGMFVHTSLQLESLCQSVSRQDVRDTLDSFPSSIEDVYHQTWKRIHSQSPKLVALAEAVLIWVTHASRSMALEELECAIAAPFSTCKFEPGRLVAGSTLLSLCRGLVVFEEESRIIRLVHYTAKGILVSLLKDTFPAPHSLLAKVCLAHLTACNFQNTTIALDEELSATLMDDPLLAYASEAWAFHTHLSLDNEDARQQASTFIAECQAFPAAVVYPVLDVLRPLHILARYNLPLSLLGCDIGNPNIATQFYHFTPLAIASSHGHTDFVRELLKQSDVRPDVADVDGWSPLMRAAFRGFEEVVTLLLSHPDTDVNLMDWDGDSALSSAASMGHEGVIIILLLQSGINVNLSNGIGQPPLIQAVSYDWEGVVKLLLAHPGVDVNAVSWEGKSALSVAAEQGYEGMVTLLLVSHGIQVNAMDRQGWSALHYAIASGHKRTVQALLACSDTDVNVSKPDGSPGHSPLMTATEKGREELVAMLLSHPNIQANFVMMTKMSALMYACMEGQAGTVTLLLSRDDVDVNLVNNTGDTVLMLAVKNGHESIVRLLVADPRVDMSFARQDGETALSLALAGQLDGIVELLQSREREDREAVRILESIANTDTLPHLAAIPMTAEDGGDQGEDAATSDSEGSETFYDAEEWLDNQRYGV